MRLGRENDQSGGHFITPRTWVVTAIVVVAAALRIAPHPMNFAPIGALALFGGAYFTNKRAAVLIPLLSMLAGDIFIGFHRLMVFIYISFLVSVAIGFLLRRTKSWPRLGVATLAGSMQFFLITNFAVWAMSVGTYPKSLAGLVTCYIAGIPFLWSTLAGDALYVVLLFGGMALAEKKFLSLRERAMAAS